MKEIGELGVRYKGAKNMNKAVIYNRIKIGDEYT